MKSKEKIREEWLKEHPYYAKGQYVPSRNMQEFYGMLLASAGRKIKVETDYLFKDQFNTVPIKGVSDSGMRINEKYVAEVIDDERRGKAVMDRLSKHFKRNPSRSSSYNTVGISLAHKVSDYLAGRFALTRPNVATALYEVTGILPTLDDIIDTINIIESGYQMPKYYHDKCLDLALDKLATLNNPPVGLQVLPGVLIAAGLGLVGYSIYKGMKG